MTKRPLDIAELAAEVSASSFDDARLNRRLSALVEGLAKDPSLSLPQSFDSAGLEAAYRFFSNPRVGPAQILSGHVEATRKRCDSEGDFLVVHDSTTLSYRFDGEREGLGRIQRSNPNSSQVLFAHASLAISADGTRRPLGLAALKTWTRGPERTGTESQRWEEQIRVASAALDGRNHAIHLADREADDYDMFHALQRDKHRFVVRCQYDRRIIESSGRTNLKEVLVATPATVEREVLLKRRKPRRTDVLRKIYPARDMRVATLCVSAAAVAVRKPDKRRASSDLSAASLTVNVVRVWEPNPPADMAAIEWYLYTSEPIDTAQQQLAIVDYYRARWTIEEYFKAIKTGCDFESRQLQDYEALVNLLATFAPIAYRLLLIRSEAARAPDEPAEHLLPPAHLDVLRAKGRTRLSTAPTARQIYLAIAALGGHLKHSGNPGWLTLARGYEKLETLAEGWRAAKLQQASDQG